MNQKDKQSSSSDNSNDYSQSFESKQSEFSDSINRPAKDPSTTQIISQNQQRQAVQENYKNTSIVPIDEFQTTLNANQNTSIPENKVKHQIVIQSSQKKVILFLIMSFLLNLGWISIVNFIFNHKEPCGQFCDEKCENNFGKKALQGMFKILYGWPAQTIARGLILIKIFQDYEWRVQFIFIVLTGNYIFQVLLIVYVQLTYTPFDNISTVFWHIVEVLIIVILALQKASSEKQIKNEMKVLGIKGAYSKTNKDKDNQQQEHETTRYLPFLFSILIWYYIALFYRMAITQTNKKYVIACTPWIMAFIDHFYIKACLNYSQAWSREMISMLYRMQSYSIESTKIAAFLSFQDIYDHWFWISLIFYVRNLFQIAAEIYVNFDWEKQKNIFKWLLTAFQNPKRKKNQYQDVKSGQVQKSTEAYFASSSSSFLEMNPNQEVNQSANKNQVKKLENQTEKQMPIQQLKSKSAIRNFFSSLGIVNRSKKNQNQKMMVGIFEYTMDNAQKNNKKFSLRKIYNACKIEARYVPLFLIIFKKMTLDSEIDLDHPLYRCNKQIHDIYDVSYYVYLIIFGTMIITDIILLILRKLTSSFSISYVYNSNFWLYFTTVAWALTISWDSINKTLIWFVID